MTSTPPNQTNCQISQCRKQLRRVTRAHPAGVLAHAHVTNVMQAVLDRPMLPGEFQQLMRVSAQAGQAGDRQHDFKRRYAIDCALACDAANLFSAGPAKPRRKLCQCFEGSCFQTAVAFILRCGRLQIVPPRHCLRRGKQARRTRPAAPV